MIIQRFWAVLFLGLLPGAVGALNFDHLGTAEGLSNSSVSSIVQDKRGFLWFGTQGGLNRWDGYEFKIYDNDPYDTGSLSHNLVQTIYLEKEQDLLWVGTYRGLNLLDLKTDKITRFLSEDLKPDSLSQNVVVSLVRDFNGALWVGTLEGLNRLRPDGKTFDRFLPNEKDPGAILGNVIRSLAVDNQGRLWVGTNKGVSLWQPGTNSFKNYDIGGAKTVMSIIPRENGRMWLGVWDLGIVDFDPAAGTQITWPLKDNRIYVLKSALEGKLLAGTWGGGLQIADPRTWSIEVERHNGEMPFSLAHDIVYSIFEDEGRILWLGTNGNGISKYDPHKRNFQYLVNNPKDPESLSFGKVGVVYEDKAKTLWIGVNNGGLCRFDDKTKKVVKYLAKEGVPGALSNNIINTIFEDSKGRFWVGTNDGLNLMDRTSGTFKVFKQALTPEMELSDDIIYKVFEDSQGRIWVGTYRKGIDIYSPDLKPLKHFFHEPGKSDSLSENMIYDILRDRRGKIWVATNKGLNRLKDDESGFYVYQNDPRDYNSLSSDTIRVLREDSTGRLWIGTIAGGVNLYDPDNNNFHHYTKKEGLVNNSVVGILEDQEGMIYMATQGGLSILNPSTGIFRNLGVSDGLFATEFTSGHGLRSSGSLLFGSTQGVQQFEYKYYPRNDHKPPVQITSLEVFNNPLALPKPLPFVKNIEISFAENYFSLKFAALDYSGPEKNQYAYKLEGFDKDWVFSGTRRYASYTNLPGGDYTFLVKGSNSDGIWNPEPTRLLIRVTPPFWDTWVFKIGAPAGVIFLVFLILSRRVRNVKKQNALLEEKVELRTRELFTINQDLQKLNETKDRFFTIVAHDLKNPFTGLLGLTDYILSEKPTAEEMLSYTAEMSKSLKSYYQLLENLLSWGRLQTGDLVIQNKTLVLAIEIDHIMELMGPAAQSKGVILTSKISDPNITVESDSDMLASLLQNLVFNGIKFTNKGGKVEISAEQLDGKVVITVSDNGVGMSEEFKKNLFRPDMKISTPGTAREKGTGLGLVLCQELAQKMGGSIEAESRQGIGSTFRVILPPAVQRRT